ncbi:MAG: hypothetical protein WCH46_10930 [bacterium]
MKYFILALALVFTSLAEAQTQQSIFDEWSPIIAGSTMHIRITSDHMYLRYKGKSIVPEGISNLMPLPPPTSSPSMKVIEGDQMQIEKYDTVNVLKIKYDSLQSKGRIFMQMSFLGLDSIIVPLSFALTDNGEIRFGLGIDFMSLFSPDTKTLKQIETASDKMIASQSHTKAKTFTPSPKTIGLEGFSLLCFSSARTTEFAKLKDAKYIPKAELIGMINSFGNRISAQLQKFPFDSTETNPLKAIGMMGTLVNSVCGTAHDLFITHGYNPLSISSCADAFKHDSDVTNALKLAGEKVEQSVPALRVAKMKREQRKALFKEQLKSMENEVPSAEPKPASVLLDKKSPVTKEEEEFVPVTSEPKPREDN